MRDFGALYRAGAVERFHTMPTHQRQTIADHSWGVIMIMLAIVDDPSGNLIKAAATHDLAESVTGDLPATVKWNEPQLRRELEALEQKFAIKHNIFPHLDKLEEEVLRWADMAELVMFCEGEIRLGNQNLSVVWRRGIVRLEQMGFPTDKAEGFYNDHINPEYSF
jgi:5'-deoxynucleotidase YfbR-like HD superfamily hydrolase